MPYDCFAIAVALALLLAATGPLRAAPTFQTLYSFKGGNDGAYPLSDLELVGGVLYGTTNRGGAAQSGTVFSIVPSTQTESIIWSFQGGNDGAGPRAGLIYQNKVFYGTTGNGGEVNLGTIYSINLSSSTPETVIHSFKGYPSDGQAPFAKVTFFEGYIFGTTNTGGSVDGCFSKQGCGTVFKVKPNGKDFSVLYSFQGVGNGGGQNPRAPLTAANGLLFGTTFYGGIPGSESGCYGGTDGCGIVFEIDPSTGILTNLHSFTGGSNDGAEPVGALVPGTDGLLYGTTQAGGSTTLCSGAGCGTIFSIDPVTGTYTPNLFTFSAVRGATPKSGLAESVHRDTRSVHRDVVYGPTTAGGTTGSGTVFLFDANNNGEKILHDFTGGADGSQPQGLTVSPPNLFGTTYKGGMGSGTVFEIKP